MWYCVHAILFLEQKEGEQHHYVAWEHLYLVEASNPDQAKEKGVIRAQQDESDSGTMLDDRPVRLKYATIRKVVECQDRGQPPSDGSEISYTEYLVENPDEFKRLIQAEPAQVIYNS
jgi:hypothetical protein